MLVAESCVLSSKGQRFLCLDLLTASFESSPPMQTEAILVEVWSSGGLLHTDRPAAPDCKFRLSGSALGRIDAKAVGCVKDENGYVVEFAVAEGQVWFPAAYRPPYLRPPKD